MPLGLGGKTVTNDPFYSFNQFQRDPATDWTKTPVIGAPAGYLEQNQDAAYNRFLAGRVGVGMGDDSPYAQYVRNQFRNTQTGFKTGLAEDPTLTYQNYLGRLGVSPFLTNWNRLSPRGRGEYPSNFGGPMRTLADL